MTGRNYFLILMLSAFLLMGFGATAWAPAEKNAGGTSAVRSGNDTGMSIVRAARQQIGVTTTYDPAYRSIAYPNGDIPAERGVCTDVLIRAFRSGPGMDLQKLIHEDMQGNFKKYPAKWGLKAPDTNIDHRRVANLMTYFERRGYSVPISKKAADYRAGDFIACIVPPGLPHIMIVSDRKSPSGQPLIIHNIGAGTKEEDRLFEFPITGHYRIK
jgi:hypothetical protein